MRGSLASRGVGAAGMFLGSEGGKRDKEGDVL